MNLRRLVTVHVPALLVVWTFNTVLAAPLAVAESQRLEGHR